MAKSFRVKLIRGLQGTSKDQRDTVRCLGLSRVQGEVVVKDNPANRGQIYKVQHLLQVKVEK
ncbi:MAG: 50S ribosomal protein L30 [Bdellovibrionales bacterium RBG_16_40_8]|nr:MAG: 50S ribosomal protein L30 [Bdellovibrionales bacterium RBG_16_40_8]